MNTQKIWSVKKDVMAIGCSAVFRVQIDCADDATAAEVCDMLAAKLAVLAARTRYEPAPKVLLQVSDPQFWEAVIHEINEQER